MAFEHVHISKGVSKLGASIPSVSLPPICTCRPDAPCASRCYAMKGRWRFSHNKSLLQRNIDLWNGDPVMFKRDVTVAAFHSRFFRWHSSGDIPNSQYLTMMVEIAESLPDVKFLCFTKKFELINDYLDVHNSFPKNLSIVFSAWGSSFIPENPHDLPVAYVRFKNNDQGSIPNDALKCSGFCGECTMSGASCWELKHGESVVFDEH